MSWLRLMLIFVSVAALLVSGCPREATPPELHECTIRVAPQPQESDTFHGSADGYDLAEVKKEAWVNVCAELPAAERPHCRDDKKFHSMLEGGDAKSGGKDHFARRVTLTRVMPVYSGSAESTEETGLCYQALTRACKAAGAPDEDCVAAGTHDELNADGGAK